MTHFFSLSPAGLDYTAVSDRPLNFDGGNATLTFQVPIFPDNITESQEQFFLSLNASSLAVTRNIIIDLSDQERNRIMFGPINGRVNITDDDSKLLGCDNSLLLKLQLITNLLYIVHIAYDRV